MKVHNSANCPAETKNVSPVIEHGKNWILKALRKHFYLILLFVAIIVYGTVFSYYTVLKHNVFASFGWDLGIFNQALYTTVHNGKLLYYTADLFQSPSGCYFAQHVSPILFLIVPLYAMISSPITLLVLKSFILAFAALPLYLLTKETLKSAKAGLLFSLVYLLYAPLQGANWFDFQPQIFLPVLFFSMFYFAAKSKWAFYLVTAVLASMVEEHISLIVFLVGLYFLITSKIRPWGQSLKSFRSLNQNLASIITMVFSAVYLFAAMWIKNLFSVNPQYLYNYKALSVYSVLGVKGDPLLFPFYVIFNPQRGYAAFTYDFPLKLLFIVFLFGPLLFFSFKSKIVLITVPFLSLFLFSNYDAYYSIGAHYPLYVLAFIFIAALVGLKRLEKNAQTSVLKAMIVASLIFTISLSPISPLSTAFVNKGLLWYPNTNLAPNENTSSIDNLVNIIPSNASVLTQNSIFPHVSSRINAYLLPFLETDQNTDYIRFLINNSEYVLLDLKWHDSNTGFVLNEITRNDSYGAYAFAREAILFKRDFHGTPMFTEYTENTSFSAYKDLLAAPFSKIVNDPSSTSKQVVLCPQSLSGCFVFGPYTYLLPGSYEIKFAIKAGTHNDGHLGWCEISNNTGSTIVSKRDIFGFEIQQNIWTNFTLTFTSTKLMTDIEFRVVSQGMADIYVDRVILTEVSQEASSDFGLKTYCSNDLSIINGYLDDGDFIVHQQNTTGSPFWFGPYTTISSGKYRISFLLSASPLPQTPTEKILTLSLTANYGKDEFAKYDVKGSDFINKENNWQEFSFEFIAGTKLKNVEFLGLSPSPNFDIRLAYIELTPIPSQGPNYVTFAVQKGLQIDNGKMANDASSRNGKVGWSQESVNKDILTYGPYIALPNGTFSAIFSLKTVETQQNAEINLEVTTQYGANKLNHTTLGYSEISDGSWFNATLSFSLETPTSNIEFRVSSNGQTNLYVDTITVLYG